MREAFCLEYFLFSVFVKMLRPEAHDFFKVTKSI